MQARPAALIVRSIACGILAARKGFHTHPEVTRQDLLTGPKESLLWETRPAMGRSGPKVYLFPDTKGV